MVAECLHFYIFGRFRALNYASETSVFSQYPAPAGCLAAAGRRRHSRCWWHLGWLSLIFLFARTSVEKLPGFQLCYGWAAKFDRNKRFVHPHRPINHWNYTTSVFMFVVFCRVSVCPELLAAVAFSMLRPATLLAGVARFGVFLLHNKECLWSVLVGFCLKSCTVLNQKLCPKIFKK